MKKRKIDSKKGFTLAEVLVTLTILGVIAAIVVPGLVTKQQQRTNVSKLKKNIAIVDNAISMAIVDNGELSRWKGAFLTTLQSYLKNSGLDADSILTLKDGATLKYTTDGDCTGTNNCGNLMIDINGTNEGPVITTISGLESANNIDVFIIPVTLGGLSPNTAFYTNTLSSLQSN